MKPIYLDDDIAPDATDAELIDGDVDIEERRAQAWAELQSFNIPAIQRTITALGLPAQHVPVGTGRIRHNEVDK